MNGKDVAFVALVSAISLLTLAVGILLIEVSTLQRDGTDKGNEIVNLKTSVYGLKRQVDHLALRQRQADDRINLIRRTK